MIALVIFFVSVFTRNTQKIDSVTYSELIALFEDNRVTEFQVDGNMKMTITAFEFERDEQKNMKRDDDGRIVIDASGKTKSYSYQMAYGFQIEQINALAERNAAFEGNDLVLRVYEYAPAEQMPWYRVYLPFIIVGIFLAVLFIFMMRQTAGGGKMTSFSKSKARVSYNDKNAVKFADVAGAEEEKDRKSVV